MAQAILEDDLYNSFSTAKKLYARPTAPISWLVEYLLVSGLYFLGFKPQRSEVPYSEYMSKIQELLNLYSDVSDQGDESVKL